MSSSASPKVSPQPLVDDFVQSREPILTSERGFQVLGELWLACYALNRDAMKVSQQPIPPCDFVL